MRVAAVDLLDDQNLVLDVDLALRLGGQLTAARVDPARFQRATQCSCESTGGGRDQVVQGRGLIWVLAGSGSVVLSHRPVGSERDLVIGRQIRLPDRTAFADDADL